MARTKKVIVASAEVEPEKSFWLCDGRSLKSLNELAKALETMDDGVWEYHVTVDKNDFANWIEDVFGEKTLGSSIRKAKSPATAAKRISSRVQGPKFWTFL